MLKQMIEVTTSFFILLWALLFKAVFLLVLFRAFKVGELVANSRLDASGCCLGICDVCWVEEGLIVKIRLSQTDRAGAGQKIKIHVAHSSPCPCLNLQAYLAVHVVLYFCMAVAHHSLGFNLPHSFGELWYCSYQCSPWVLYHSFVSLLQQQWQVPVWHSQPFAP